MKRVKPVKKGRSGLGFVEITHELIQAGKSVNGGLNNKQLSILGVTRLLSGKLPSTWRYDVLGCWITKEAANRFLRLKNAHLKKNKLKHPETAHIQAIREESKLESETARWRTPEEARQILKKAIAS